MSIVETIYESIELTVINCGECGGTYSINERYRKQKCDKGGGWHCPYCQCSWGYWGKTEAEKLQAQLEAEQRANKFLRKQNETERNRTRAQKAAKTRLKNRIKNGVCPCCNRHFKNLHQHMQNQHPDYVEEKK